MVTIPQLLEEALRSAQGAQWAAHRSCLAKLREALAGAPDASEALRTQVEMLNCASPAHDSEGYLAELKELAALIGAGSGLQGAGARSAPIDLRGLKPPEPIVRIFQALEQAPGEPLRVILPHEPLPLYGLLRERGFSCSGSPRADGGYELLIERA